MDAVNWPELFRAAVFTEPCACGADRGLDDISRTQWYMRMARPLLPRWWHYLDGNCELLALAVRFRTGWPVACIWSTDPDTDFHALVQLPDGRLLDAAGLHDAAELGEIHPGIVIEPEGAPAEEELRYWPDILADADELLSMTLSPWAR